VINCLAILLFGSVCILAVYNMCKFYRHRSYALGLFYIFTIVNLVIRCLYFSTLFFTETSYLSVILLCSPASFSCSIGLCQIMNYVVLYIRLDSYVSHRTLKRGDEVSSEELAKATFREAVAKAIFTTFILAYPIVIAILLGLHKKDYSGNVIGAW